MKVEILVIGNEVLIGKTQDTNSNWMAKRITKYGHKVMRITTIGDDLETISSTIRLILEREPHILISCGGLGPTFDDMTLKGVAQGLGRELKKDEHAYQSIKKAYKNAYEQGILKLQGMTPEREKMAYLPERSTPLPNIRGTAPGAKIKEENTFIFCLPGVPMEMKAMFKNIILPILKDKRGKFVEKNFISMDVGESQLAPYVSELEDAHPELWIKTHPRVGLAVEVEISVTCFNVENGEKLAEEVIEKLKKVVRDLDGKIKGKKDNE
ncbi:MAG: damage-inducible protein CinA [Candidatus Lokiarchaeota archaeon]|nr:damage-inducible protein CinA [Candidatus Lokiarchaeota archaeon]MBD3339483.1 damage-inducible protein CinA [Candidatus Lokiarchaeota archaeon]